MMSRKSIPQSIFLLEQPAIHGHGGLCFKDPCLLVLAFAVIAWLALVITPTDHQAGDVVSITAKRHPLTRVPTKQKDDGSIRFLTFGSFDLWGHGLSDYNLAYPWLLDGNVNNAAVHHGGTALPAVCTESMTGEDVFDVIVIDYFMQVATGLDVLAKRIRKRFPNALIVFVRRWNPSHIVYQGASNSTSRQDNAITFLSKRRFGNFHSDDFKNALSETKPEDWKFDHVNGRNDRIITEVMEAVGGRLIELPHPDDWNAMTALSSYMHLFNKDGPLALSERGHSVIASLIFQLVEHEKIAEKSMAVRNELGTWGAGDFCQMWYTTGALDTSLQYSSKVKMKKFADQWGDKFALEFPREGGSITVTNPFEFPRMLYLTYMTTGLAVELYPQIQIYLGKASPVILDATTKKLDRFTHVPRTVAVGLIDPGKTVVRVVPINEKRALFRLTGASIFGNSDVPTEFTLELQPADGFH
jgi:CheY-like chemotaxis protein